MEKITAIKIIYENNMQAGLSFPIGFLGASVGADTDEEPRQFKPQFFYTKKEFLER